MLNTSMQIWNTKGQTTEFKRYEAEEAHKELENSDDDNCVVRAIAAATGSTYKKSYDFCEKYLGRKHGNGTAVAKLYFTYTTVNVWEEFKQTFGKKLSHVGSDWKGEGAVGSYFWIWRHRGAGIGKVKYNGTVGSFLKQYKKGTYLVGVKGHTFAVIDGVVVGNHSDAVHMRVRVLRFVKVS